MLTPKEKIANTIGEKIVAGEISAKEGASMLGVSLSTMWRIAKKISENKVYEDGRKYGNARIYPKEVLTEKE